MAQRRSTKPKSNQQAEQKPTCFLRLPPGLYSWLVSEVATGRYGNVQDKIIDVLRDAQEGKLRQHEQQAA